MKEKKTEVIPFRYTETTKKKITEIANIEGKTISQLMEQIVDEFLNETEEIEIQNEDEARKIFDFIKKSDCTSMWQLTAFAIENDCLYALKEASQIWEAILKEKERKGG